jgi:hypothetical protein
MFGQLSAEIVQSLIKGRPNNNNNNNNNNNTNNNNNNNNKAKCIPGSTLRVLAGKKICLPGAYFGLFPPYRTTVLAHFLLFLPTGPLWIMNMDHCVLENWLKKGLDPFLGPRIRLWGPKGQF